MKTDHPFKAGDKVIQFANNRDRRLIRTVEEVNDFVVRLESKFNSFRWLSAREFIIATPELIAEIEADMAAEKSAQEAEQARIEADPRTPSIRRLQGDWHQWDRLTLEQLQQVEQWLAQPQPTEGA